MAAEDGCQLNTELSHTPDRSLGALRRAGNNPKIGVDYGNNRWAIFDQDPVAMPVNTLSKCWLLNPAVAGSKDVSAQWFPERLFGWT